MKNKSQNLRRLVIIFPASDNEWWVILNSTTFYFNLSNKLFNYDEFIKNIHSSYKVNNSMKSLTQNLSHTKKFKQISYVIANFIQLYYNEFLLPV